MQHSKIQANTMQCSTVHYNAIQSNQQPLARMFDADDTLNASSPSQACSWASAECGFAERLNSESESVNKTHGNQLY